MTDTATQLESVLIGDLEKHDVVVVPYRPEWPDTFRVHADRISAALGDAALRIEHIGSTAVPGLAAKPVVDMLVVVENSADERTYLQPMLDRGYHLRVREPDFEQHRMFRTPERDVHVHFLSAGSAEIERYLVFREALRGNAVWRERYQAFKRSLADRGWRDVNAYAAAKTDLIEEIIRRSRPSESLEA